MAKTVAFGNNEYTEILTKLVPVDFIVDEFSSEKSAYNCPIVRLSEVSQADNMINCVYNSRAAYAHLKLRSQGFKPIFIGDFVNRHPKEFAATMLAQAQAGINEDFAIIERCLPYFADQQSRDELTAIVQFRYTLDIQHLMHFDVKIDQQYFENFVLNKKFNCLIDGGAYDGHDSIRFIELFDPIHQVYLFEPNIKNIELIKSNIAKRNMTEFLSSGKITVKNACLSDKLGYAFLEGEGTETKITKIFDKLPSSPRHEGNCAEEVSGYIETTSIDTEVSEMITNDINARVLVKLDIEGAEMSALKGAIQSRDNENVGFAISAYHLPHDLTDIFTWLQSSSISRKYYFRHYSNGICESVLFAI